VYTQEVFENVSYDIDCLGKNVHLNRFLFLIAFIQEEEEEKDLVDPAATLNIKPYI